MVLKTIKSVAVVGILTVVAYWYWSPFLAIRQLQSAAQTKDANSFNERVDYPKLRESLKGQFSAMMAEKMGKSVDVQNPFAAIGSALGLVMVNQVVETMVRPEVVMQTIRNGKFGTQAPVDSARPSPEQPDKSVEAARTAPPDYEKPEWTYERKSVDKLLAYAVDPKNPEVPNGKKTGLMFERRGFADWKLTELRLPARDN